MNIKEKRNHVYLRVLECAEQQNLDWITIHPKTVTETSLQPVDLKALKECVENSSIPIIGNGGVTDEDSALKMLQTGVQGLMIARAAVADPFIFKRINHFLSTGKNMPLPSKQEYENALSRYLDLAEVYNIPEYYVEYHTRMFKLKIEGRWDHFHTPKTDEKWI